MGAKVTDESDVCSSQVMKTTLYIEILGESMDAKMTDESVTRSKRS